MRLVCILLVIFLCEVVHPEEEAVKPNVVEEDIALEIEGKALKKDELPEHLNKPKSQGDEQINSAQEETNLVHNDTNININTDTDPIKPVGDGGEHDPDMVEDFKVGDHLGDHGELEGLFKDSFDPYEGEHEAADPDIEQYDFDPSEGLSFVIHEGTMECFYENVKSDEDHVSGAYIVSAADSKIDLILKDPNGIVVVRRYGEVEDEYEVTDTEIGEYEICFSNINYSGDKLITHVTHTLQSHHPVEKQHVSHLAQYAAHLDIKLGEFESEQRLLQIRMDRHIKTEQSTNQRVTYYSTFELLIYIVVSVLQVAYIKHLLDVPRHKRTWA